MGRRVALFQDRLVIRIVLQSISKLDWTLSPHLFIINLCNSLTRYLVGQ
jgi:hypothetical protein